MFFFPVAFVQFIMYNRVQLNSIKDVMLVLPGQQKCDNKSITAGIKLYWLVAKIVEESFGTKEQLSWRYWDL